MRIECKRTAPSSGSVAAAIGDDEHVARLALGVGGLRGVAVQVLDVVAQAFLGDQALDEAEVALAVRVHRLRVRSVCAISIR